MKFSIPTGLARIANRRAWAFGLFWSWNLIFLAFVFFGFAPQLVPDLISSVQAGTIPVSYLIYGVILTLVPAGAVALGATLLRRSPERLFALGYAIEAPLMLMLLVLFFIVRDATVAMTLLFVVAGLGLAAFLWQLLDREIDRRSSFLTALRLVGLTLFFIVALYVSLFLAFYVIPLGIALLQGLWNLVIHFGDFLAALWRGLGDLPKNFLGALFFLLGTLLALYTATLLVVMPVAVPLLAARAWRRALGVFAQSGRLLTAGITTVTIAACALLLVWANQQPQETAFKLLRTPPATPAEAQALLQQQDVIRAGLLNAYLAPLRYISAVGEVQHIHDLYDFVLHLPPEATLQIEKTYEFVAAPLLYTPVHPPTRDPSLDHALQNEPGEAAALYQQFFDEPIVKGEQATIVNAVRSTWQASQAIAAVQQVDDRKVHLDRQEIVMTPHGDWAEVELHEVYQNQTTQRQEVIYYFTLPESAVVTGLWLGNSDDKSQRFAYRVSPRGAAQQAYRNEVRYNYDPALVEQIGPRQYRLRVFPVEPKQWAPGGTTNNPNWKPGPLMHVWMTWRVLARDHSYPFPVLSDKRNIYWDRATVRRLNGQPLDQLAEWLVPAAPANAEALPAVHRFDAGNGESVIARPLAAGNLPPLPAGLRVAVVLDRSRSMQAHSADVNTALASLKQKLASSQVDVYLTATAYRGEGPSRVSWSALLPEQLSYIGGQNASDLLVQFDSLRVGTSYDAAFVLTDGSGYATGQSQIKPAISGFPIWMVHLGWDFPPGYDDGTLDALQASGGGATGSVQEALDRLAVRLQAARDGWQGAPANAVVDYVDGYIWLTVPSGDADQLADGVTSDAAFAPIAARRVILAAMQRQHGALTQNEVLDQLHALAKQHSIVTSYSSMLVLVNAGQDYRLDSLEAQSDRFQREVEQLGTTTPAALGVTGVPELEEWLLMALAGVLLVWFGRRRYRRSAL
ncbi:MAG: TIGR02921 family PEP-CTERM protein [Anaerolineae bacterium]